MKKFIQQIEALPEYVTWHIAKIIQHTQMGNDHYTVHQKFIGTGAVEWFEDSDMEITYDGDTGNYTIRWG